MANNSKVNIGVGFTVDKAGLEELQSLFQRISYQAKNSGTGLTEELKKAGQTAQTLDGILEKTFNTDLGTLNVTKFNQEMQKSGLTMKQVKADLTAIGGQGATAYNRLAQAVMSTNIQLKQSSKLLDSMFVTFKNTVRYGISSSIFNNFTNSIAKAYEYTKKLDTSLNNIRIVTGKSADEIDDFAEKANQAAKNLSASTLDVTNASLIYYQQGIRDQEEIAARTETTIKMANVTGQSAETVSNQMTAIWNNFAKGGQNLEYYADVITALGAATASSSAEISTGLSKFAAIADTVGLSYENATAALATITATTRQSADSVGTGLRTLFARLQSLSLGETLEDGVNFSDLGRVILRIRQGQFYLDKEPTKTEGNLGIFNYTQDETIKLFEGIAYIQLIGVKGTNDEVVNKTETYTINILKSLWNESVHNE